MYTVFFHIEVGKQTAGLLIMHGTPGLSTVDLIRRTPGLSETVDLMHRTPSLPLTVDLMHRTPSLPLTVDLMHRTPSLPLTVDFMHRTPSLPVLAIGQIPFAFYLWRAQI